LGRRTLASTLKLIVHDREKSVKREVQMTGDRSGFQRVLLAGVAAITITGGWVWASAASAQQFAVKPIAEKKVAQLPAGPLFWRIDTFPTLAKAQSAAGPTAVAVAAAGKDWLFTLGPPWGGCRLGAARWRRWGPVPSITAPEYLLRIVGSGGPPGAKTPVHTHPGSETFYVLTGQLTPKTPEGVMQVSAGQSMPGHPPGTPMQVSSPATMP
jgi:hypothetical protein